MVIIMLNSSHNNMTDSLVKNLNLSPQEAKLYLAALELSPATAAVLAEKAGIERTASYPHLEDLVKMGLLSVRPEKNKSLYIAENPKKIGEILEDKQKEFKQVLPDLMSLFNTKGIKPKVRYYEGREGMKSIIMNSISGEAREKLHLMPTINVIEIMGEEFAKHYIDLRVKRGIKVKTLRIREKIEKPWEVTSSDPSLLREVRYLPESFDLENLIMIYANTVSIISSSKENYGLEIESKEFADTMRSFFNMVWLTSTK